MRYKIVERQLVDKEGNVLDKKFEVKQRFLKWFWKSVGTHDNSSLAVRQVESYLKDDMKQKCSWVKKDFDMSSIKEIKPHKAMVRRKPRGGK